MARRPTPYPFGRLKGARGTLTQNGDAAYGVLQEADVSFQEATDDAALVDTWQDLTPDMVGGSPVRLGSVTAHSYDGDGVWTFEVTSTQDFEDTPLNGDSALWLGDKPLGSLGTWRSRTIMAYIEPLGMEDPGIGFNILVGAYDPDLEVGLGSGISFKDSGLFNGASVAGKVFSSSASTGMFDGGEGAVVTTTHLNMAPAGSPEGTASVGFTHATSLNEDRLMIPAEGAFASSQLATNEVLPAGEDANMKLFLAVCRTTTGEDTTTVTVRIRIKVLNSPWKAPPS